MTIFLAFLRGVNVGGHRKIPMDKGSPDKTGGENEIQLI
ncbi:MAG: DUF1697 domain-containing protein [Bacteroidetes bacterium]|nr:DUF1697 domain-containing protein [Bacteroidota bacterium]